MLFVQDPPSFPLFFFFAPLPFFSLILIFYLYPPPVSLIFFLWAAPPCPIFWPSPFSHLMRPLYMTFLSYHLLGTLCLSTRRQKEWPVAWLDQFHGAQILFLWHSHPYYFPIYLNSQCFLSPPLSHLLSPPDVSFSLTPFALPFTVMFQNKPHGIFFLFSSLYFMFLNRLSGTSSCHNLMDSNLQGTKERFWKRFL